MKRVQTPLPDVFELRPTVYPDSRGYFIETYHRAKFVAQGIEDVFVQDNQSCSTQGTLRGLHYQLQHPQAKLCRVVEGEALDVAVDIRLGSPNFGKWAAVTLSAKDQNQLYVPIGFAHGFLALTPIVQFLYKCTDFYSPADECGVLWDDPDLGIPWGDLTPVLSSRDRSQPRLRHIRPERLPKYQGS